ncbi:MAG: hypothetical protein WAT92_18430 [Saprospiraceae bacterium]
MKEVSKNHVILIYLLTCFWSCSDFDSIEGDFDTNNKEVYYAFVSDFISPIIYHTTSRSITEPVNFEFQPTVGISLQNGIDNFPVDVQSEDPYYRLFNSAAGYFAQPLDSIHLLDVNKIKIASCQIPEKIQQSYKIVAIDAQTKDIEIEVKINNYEDINGAWGIGLLDKPLIGVRVSGNSFYTIQEFYTNFEEKIHHIPGTIFDQIINKKDIIANNGIINFRYRFPKLDENIKAKDAHIILYFSNIDANIYNYSINAKKNGGSAESSYTPFFFLEGNIKDRYGVFGGYSVQTDTIFYDDVF